MNVILKCSSISGILCDRLKKEVKFFNKFGYVGTFNRKGAKVCAIGFDVVVNKLPSDL